MKILKQGLSKAELERKEHPIKRFECYRCGCIFEAENTEYSYEDDDCRRFYFSKCPNCGDKAYEKPMSRTKNG